MANASLLPAPPVHCEVCPQGIAYNGTDRRSEPWKLLVSSGLLPRNSSIHWKQNEAPGTPLRTEYSLGFFLLHYHSFSRLQWHLKCCPWNVLPSLGSTIHTLSSPGTKALHSYCAQALTLEPQFSGCGHHLNGHGAHWHLEVTQQAGLGMNHWISELLPAYQHQPKSSLC